MTNSGDVDPAFSGLSQKPGLEIWRISDGDGVTRLDVQEHGSFYTGDVYLVLKVTALRSGGVVSAVHYWLGKNATKADAKLAAAKAMDLDMALGSKSIGLLRELQGHESDLFLSYFRPCILPLNGAKGVPDEEGSKGDPRLWQIKGERFVHVRQVPFARTSLAHSCVYILNDDKKIFQFNGASCSKQARSSGLEVAKVIRERAAGASVAVVEDNDMTTADAVAFWDHFGGFAPIPKRTSLEDDVEEKPGPAVLTWFSANGSAEMARGTELQRKFLEASRCVIVDVGPQVFVWRGRTSTLEDRRAAAVAAEAILAKSRPASTRILVLNERSETAEFRDLFADWHGVKGGPEGGASTKLKALSANLRSASFAHGAKLEPLPPLLPEGPADVKVWRLNGKERQMLGPEELGIFYSGDCYLIQFTFSRDRRQEHVLFFWVGRQSTAEEWSLCAASAERMADTRGSHTTLIRVVQGREPEQFFTHFRRNLFFFQGGQSATYRSMVAKEGGDATKHPVLLLVKPLPEGHFMTLQMPLVAKSLNSSDCFLLMTHSNPILWVGGRSGEPQLAAAQAAAEYLRPGLQPRRLVEGKETTVFWGHLGGKSEYPPSAETRDGPREPRLFHLLSAASSLLKMKEVPGFRQEDLFMEDVMILDSFQEVFVWLGSAVPEAERKEAYAAGLRYVDMVASTEGRSKDTTVVRLAEGNELPMFTGLFGSWHPIKLGVHLDPYERQMALLNGTSLDELEAQHRKQASSHDTGPSQRASAFAAIRESIASASSSGRSSEEKPSPLQPQSSFSQKQAALAALQSSLEKPPLKSPLVTSPSARSPTASAFSSSEASPGAVALGTPNISPQQAAAIAALRATLGEKHSDGMPSSHTTPRSGATQGTPSSTGAKSAEVAALMEGFQAEQSQGSRGTPQGLQPLAVVGEDGSLTSPPSQRAAALAALQNSLSPQEGRSAAASPRSTSGSGLEAVAHHEAASADVSEADSVDESVLYPLERLRVSAPNPVPGIDTTRRELRQPLGTSAGAMKCFARALDLKDDPKLIAEYLEYHKNVWPEVLENIKASGIEQMRIFVLGTRLFMYCEVPDDFDPSGDFNKNANSSRAAEWEKLMMTYQQKVPSADEAASGLWTDMALCFDLKEQLSRQK